MQRRVSSRGWIAVAGQRVGVGIGHAGATVTVEEADGTFRITCAGQVVTEVARTTPSRSPGSRSASPSADRRIVP
ncbi:hypothetical protein AAH991_38925, partial [Microbispora sp. ZYX-F-249]